MTITHTNPRAVRERIVLAIACLLAAATLALNTGSSAASHADDRAEHPVERTFSWGYPPNTLPSIP